LVGGSLDDDISQRIHLLTGYGYMNWSPPISDGAGGSCREFRECGGVYGHAPVSIRIPLAYGPIEDFSICVTYSSASASEDVLVQIFDGVEYVTLAELAPSTGSNGARVSQRISLTSNGAISQGKIENELQRSDFTYGAGT